MPQQVVRKEGNRYNITNLELEALMAMTETERQTKVLILSPTKIVQKKRKITAFSQKSQIAKTAKNPCKEHVSLL
ncbi:MAG: hypothetical protein AB7P69_27140, partial [Candidatus Binatia bacterium]